MLDQTAIILSGGINRRMNYNNKAFLEMDGRKLIEIVMGQLSQFKETIIVSNEPENYEYLKAAVVTDVIPNRGPMGGIHAGLVHAAYEYCFVLPCDMPFIPRGMPEFLSNLSFGYDVTVPKLKGKYQPLCGVYHKNCVDPIETCLNNGLNKIVHVYPLIKVRDVMEEELSPFGDAETIFRNINNPEDYIRYCIERSSVI